jgi:hypothetical protein
VTADDRLALRLGALHRARRRQSVGEGAWAASRLRLEGVVLDRKDAAFGRDALVRFGRALRVARARRPMEGAVPLAAIRPLPKGRSRIAWLVAAGLVVVMLVLLLLITVPARPVDETEGGGTPAAGGVPATASPLRGRSDQIVAVVPVVTATPAPTEAPTATPETTIAPSGRPGGATAGTGGGGSGTGGSGGGSGSGSGSGSGTARPTPTPSPPPPPTVDPATLETFYGYVVDSRSGRPIPGVCVAVGVINCAGAPTSDANGYWEVTVTIGQSWDLRFIKNGYLSYLLRVTSTRTGRYQVPDITLRAR